MASITSDTVRPRKTSAKVTAQKKVKTQTKGGALTAALAHPSASYFLVLGPVVLLMGLGILMGLSSSAVYAAKLFDNPYYFSIRQVVFMVIGLPFAWWLSRRSPRALQLLGWLGLIGAMLLLIAVLSPLGVDEKGNRAWLALGPISLQPAEFAKIAVILWGSAALAAKHRSKTLDQPKSFIPTILGFGMITGLVLLQGDLGTALILIMIFFAFLWIVGTPLRLLLALVVAGLAVVWIMVTSSANRMNRIMLFLNPPDSGDHSVSQQPLSAIYALATGGWFGVGLGGSRQKWGGLYDGAQNDFVFAVLGEELGLMGTLGVLALFFVLSYAGYRIATRNDDFFIKVVAATTTFWLIAQAGINIAVALKMIPVVGVPLPFISVGGSALLSNTLAAGVLLACARQEPAARRAREARKGIPRPRVTTVVDGRH